MSHLIYVNLQLYGVTAILIDVPKDSCKFGQLWAECAPALDATTARAHRAVDQVGHTLEKAVTGRWPKSFRQTE